MASEDIFASGEEILENINLNLEQPEEVAIDCPLNTDVERIREDNDEVINEERVQEENKSNTVEKKSTQKVHQETKLLQLPLSRIRGLMKLDEDLQIASAEAVFVIAKATEMFIESLARESYTFTAQAKKKTIQKRDVDLTFTSIDSLMFLEGAME